LAVITITIQFKFLLQTEIILCGVALLLLVVAEVLVKVLVELHRVAAVQVAEHPQEQELLVLEHLDKDSVVVMLVVLLKVAAEVVEPAPKVLIWLVEANLELLEEMDTKLLFLALQHIMLVAVAVETLLQLVLGHLVVWAAAALAAVVVMGLTTAQVVQLILAVAAVAVNAPMNQDMLVTAVRVLSSFVMLIHIQPLQAQLAHQQSR
jgi:hypothetical protein